jgi:hypothetical protein
LLLRSVVPLIIGSRRTLPILIALIRLLPLSLTPLFFLALLDVSLLLRTRITLTLVVLPILLLATLFNLPLLDILLLLRTGITLTLVILPILLLTSLFNLSLLCSLTFLVYLSLLILQDLLLLAAVFDRLTLLLLLATLFNLLLLLRCSSLIYLTLLVTQHFLLVPAGFILLLLLLSSVLSCLLIFFSTLRSFRIFLFRLGLFILTAAPIALGISCRAETEQHNCGGKCRYDRSSKVFIIHSSPLSASPIRSRRHVCN